MPSEIKDTKIQPYRTVTDWPSVKEIAMVYDVLKIVGCIGISNAYSAQSYQQISTD